MNEVEKIYYSYQDIHNLVKKMSQKVTQKFGKIDLIISIATGGWIPARILRTFLPHSENLPLPLFSIGIINYDSEDNLLDEAVIVQELPAKLNIEGKNILVVDEVADSGGTFIKAVEYIQTKKPASLHTAVLHLKEQSDFIPDIVGENARNNWIVYPWDVK